MSAELIDILSVGVKLGSLVLAPQLRTEKRLEGFEARNGGVREEDHIPN